MIIQILLKRINFNTSWFFFSIFYIQIKWSMICFNRGDVHFILPKNAQYFYGLLKCISSNIRNEFHLYWLKWFVVGHKMAHFQYLFFCFATYNAATNPGSIVTKILWKFTAVSMFVCQTWFLLSLQRQYSFLFVWRSNSVTWLPFTKEKCVNHKHHQFRGIFHPYWDVDNIQKTVLRTLKFSISNKNERTNRTRNLEKKEQIKLKLWLGPNYGRFSSNLLKIRKLIHFWFFHIKHRNYQNIFFDRKSWKHLNLMMT